MIETTAEGFKILVGTDGSKQFMIDSDRLDESLRYIQQNDLRFIGINSYLGFKLNDISFLSQVAEFVEGITIPEAKYDTAILNRLHNLKVLGLADSKTSTIDLRNFPNLHTLACEFSRRIVGLDSCVNLRNLSLTHYDSAAGDLSQLPRLRDLEELNLFQTNIASLTGIEDFESLRTLTFFRANKLTNLDDLRSMQGHLQTLEIDQCKRIKDYHVLGLLTELRRLMISKSAPIDSLEFIKSLENLEFFSFVETNVISGDLSPCWKVPYVGFDDRRHYSHSYDEFMRRSGIPEIPTTPKAS